MISRRALLEGAAAATIVVVTGGAVKAFGVPDSLILPPGSQDNDAFWARCVRCEKCINICPKDAIGFATVEDGLLAMRAPIMEFRHGYCDTCDGAWNCIKACPAEALQSFNPMVDKIGIASIDVDKCETYGISASCNAACIEACPTEALYFDEQERLQIDGDACWGCGACEYVCPSNAYRTYDGSKKRGINIVAPNAPSGKASLTLLGQRVFYMLNSPNCAAT